MGTNLHQSPEKIITELDNYMWINNIYTSADIELQQTIAMHLLRIIVNLTGDGQRQNQLFYRAEKELDIHILRCVPENAYKEPVPKVSELPDELWEKEYGVGIEWNEQEGLGLLNQFVEYSDEYVERLSTAGFNPDEGPFRYHDAAVYYFMIRHFSPKRIMEIGVGTSTKIASLASRNKTEIIGVDPYYESDIPGIKLIRKPVQQVPIPEFKKLEKNDILFIDCSHVSKIGSDVNYLFLEVLPQLNDGVMIHVHDIHLPNELPKSWIKTNAIFWNEQYLLHAFLIFNSKFKVLLSNSFMGKFHPEALLKVYKCATIDVGSIWLQKVENAELNHENGSEMR